MPYLRNTLGFISIFIFGVLCFAGIDGLAASLSADTLANGAARYFPLVGFGVLLSWFWQALLFAGFWSFLLSIRSAERRPSKRDGLLALATITITLVVHATLSAYEPFRVYLPFLIALFGWCIALMGLFAVSASFKNRWPSYAAGGATIAVSIVVVVANYNLYRGLYPTLHETIIEVTLVSFLVALFSCLWGLTQRSIWVAVSLIACSVAIVFLGWDAPASTSAQHRHFSEIGRVLPSKQKTLSAPNELVKPDKDAEKRFREASGFPELPQHFAIDDYNILLIGVEATRFDRTSLAGPKFGTTPRLKTYAEQGYVMTRAYSPSSGTLHSLSSMFTMKYPSSIKMTTWMQAWLGELSRDETTVAELLEDVRFSRWWIGHSYEEVFTNSILGLNQGFDSVELVPEYKTSRANTDAVTIELTIEKLKTFANKPEEKFFGFVFLSSPHGPYIARYRDAPRRTAHDRYLQELRNVDDQLEKLFTYLDDSGLRKRTVIIFFSDHGEEFREHGGLRHKSTVYEESTHVPLVVWVPGMEPGRSDHPTSTMYVFPYLFLSARDDGLRSSIKGHLETYLGPIMRETNGAVISELVGHDRIKVAVISQNQKLIHDYRSGLFQLFDSKNDAMDKRDVYDDDGFVEIRSEMQKRFDGYDRLRGAFFNHKFDKTKQTPPTERSQKPKRKKRPNPLLPKPNK